MKRMALILMLAACGGGSEFSTEAPDAGPRGTAEGGTVEGGTANAPNAGDGAPDVTPARACPTFADKVSDGTLESDAMPEASGIVASRKNKGVLWVHNDSANPAELFAITATGKTLGTYTIAGATNVDWEDITIGPGSAAGEWDIYVGDIGDNDKKRTQVQIYRVAEPMVDVNQAPVKATLPSATLPLLYPDGPHNAESLVFDPRSKSLYIVTKSADGVSVVFEKSAPHEAGAVTSLKEKARLNFSEGALLTVIPTTTAADISPDGSEIIIKTYTTQFLWRRGDNQTVEEALGGTPCPIPVGPGEGIGFSADGNAYYTVSEGLHTPLYHFDRK